MNESAQVPAEPVNPSEQERRPDGVRVEFYEGRDPRLFCVSTGEEVTTRCSLILITVYPHQYAEATLYRHRSGNPYLDEETGSVAVETQPVVEMTGTWRRG